MKTKTKIILPILLLLVILGAAVGGWLWYDANVDRSGWVEEDGVRFYQDFYADPISGWLELEDGRYYFQEGGIPSLGWQEIDGITYWFGENGTMHTGWLEEGGKTYYFGGNGTMVVGWLWLEEGRYYLRDGELLTGWQQIGQDTYHFNEDGIATLGFAEIDGERYYFDGGVMATGYREINGLDYYFRKDGTMFSGWEELDEGLRYYLPDGRMARGWQEIEGQRYYFNDSGFLHTGWLQLGEYRYFLHESGVPATGPTYIDGQLRYFSPKGIEVVLVNALNPVPDWYKLDPVNVTGYHDVDRLCYDALMRMLSDLESAGIEYEFNSAYRTIEEQTAIMEYRTREHMKNFKLEFTEARDMAMETVAIPGTSEHHLGLAVDLLGSEVVNWLTEHCWDYGFIVRYTEEKESITGIVDEPWHFRYVGTEVSLDMKGSGLCLEEYLGADPVDMEQVKQLYGDSLYQEVIYGKETQTTQPKTTSE